MRFEQLIFFAGNHLRGNPVCSLEISERRSAEYGYVHSYDRLNIDPNQVEWVIEQWQLRGIG